MSEHKFELGPISKAIVAWIGAMRNEHIEPKEISLPVEAFVLLEKETSFASFLFADEEMYETKITPDRIVGEFMGMRVRLTPH